MALQAGPLDDRASRSCGGLRGWPEGPCAGAAASWPVDYAKGDRMTPEQRADYERLTKPRPFEFDPEKHQAQLREDLQAAERLRAAGVRLPHE